MAVPDRTGVSPTTSQTEQYVLNYSFDELYRLLMVGLTAYNATTNAYDRIQIDPSTGGLKTDSGQLAQQLADLIGVLRDSQNVVPYARDTSDQMRTVVASGSITVNGLTFANNGSSTTYYGQGSPNSIDMREQLELQSMQNFNTVRNGRWQIT